MDLIQEPESKYRIRFFDCDPIGHLSNVRYLDYMLNAREDHCRDYYDIDTFEQSKKTGCTWVAVQNQISYLKEVGFNKVVTISSKNIHFTNKTITTEILMYNEDKTIIHAVLWLTTVYFDLKTRKATDQPGDLLSLYEKTLTVLDEKLFEQRSTALRAFNKH